MQECLQGLCYLNNSRVADISMNFDIVADIVCMY